MNQPLTGPSAAVTAGILDYSPEYDPETLEIFMEEGEELLVAMDQGIKDWEKEPSKTSTLGITLMRTMHTMKGGSRMAGLTGLGNISHELEHYLRAWTTPGTPELYALLRSYQPVVLRGIEQGRALAAGAPLTATAPAAVPVVAAVAASKPPVDARAAAEKAAAEKMAADKAVADKAAKIAADKQAQEARIAQAVKDAQIAREAAAAKDAQTAREAAVAKAAAEKALAEKALAEKALAEKALAEKALAEKALAEKALAEKALADKALADKALADKALADKALADKALADKALADKALADKALAEKALAEKALAEKALAEKALAEKALADKALADKALAEKALAEKALAEKALAEKALAEKALAEKALAEKALAEKALAEKALADKALADKALADKALADKALADKAAADKAAADKALADKALAEKALAEKALADKALADKALADKALADKALADKAAAKDSKAAKKSASKQARKAKELAAKNARAAKEQAAQEAKAAKDAQISLDSEYPDFVETTEESSVSVSITTTEAQGTYFGGGLTAYRDFLRSSEGKADRELMQLEHREHYFAEFEHNHPQSRFTVDHALFARCLHDTQADKTLDKRILWLAATVKLRAPERFGITLGQLYSKDQTPSDREPERLYIPLQEHYHARMLTDVIDLFGLPCPISTPQFSLNNLVRPLMVLPKNWILPLVGASALSSYSLLRAMRNEGMTLFADEPEIAQCIDNLYTEILADKISHAGLIAAQLSSRGKSVARWLARNIAGKAIAASVPELQPLFGKDRLHALYSEVVDLKREAEALKGRAYAADNL